MTDAKIINRVMILVLKSVLLLGILVFWGCASNAPGYYLTVENSGDIVLESVSVTFGSDRYEFGDILPHAVAKTQRYRSSSMDASRLEWHTQGGVSKTATLNAESPESARAVFHYVIGKGGDTKLFIIDKTKELISDLPWSTPAQWEGSPTIPGLTTQR